VCDLASLGTRRISQANGLNVTEPRPVVVLGIAKDTAAAIAFVTALVGFGKLIYEGWALFTDVLPWLGAAYVASIGALVVYRLVRPRPNVSRWQVLAGAILLLAPIAGLIWWFGMSLIGVIGLGVLVALAVLAYADYRSDPARAKKACPDCAETVKAAANVCHFCGHRFRPVGEPVQSLP
jgi:hypothetical protein